MTTVVGSERKAHVIRDDAEAIAIAQQLSAEFVIAKALKDTADFMVAQKAIPSAPDQETYQKRILYL